MAFAALPVDYPARRAGRPGGHGNDHADGRAHRQPAHASRMLSEMIASSGRSTIGVSVPS
jgi:hypothetical protein